MEQVIYGDTLFLVNASMDFLALFLTCRILWRRARPVPLSIAAVLGGVYGVASLFLQGNIVVGFLLHIATAVLLCAVGIGVDRDLWRSTVLFYMVSLVIGGTMTALFAAANRISGKTAFYNGTLVTLESDIPPLWFCVMAVLAGIGTWGVSRVFRRDARRRRATVRCVINGNQADFTALADSGNLLCEPVSGRPVILVALDSVRSVIPEPLLPVFTAHKTEILPDLPFSLARRVRLIPARGVGGSRVLCALLPDETSVDGVSCPACLAPMEQPQGSFGGCAGLVPITLLH